MRRTNRKSGLTHLSAFLLTAAFIASPLVANAQEAVCELDWNCDGQVSWSDVWEVHDGGLNSIKNRGFYADVYYYTVYHNTYPQYVDGGYFHQFAQCGTMSNPSPGNMDWNGDGVITMQDAYEGKAAASNIDTFYTQWYVYENHPDAYAYYYPNSDCNPLPDDVGCEGNCGGYSAGASCYCDNNCVWYGDCCDDYADFCEPCAGVGDDDADGICNDKDICAGHDDLVDTDSDKVPDGCDVCPNDNPDDPDGNGVCGQQATGDVMTAVETGTVLLDEENVYSYDVVGGTNFSAYLAMQTGKAHVYVHWDTVPNPAENEWDCLRNVSAGYEYGCDLLVPAGTTKAYVMVLGKVATSAYTLTVNYTSPGIGCPDDDGDGVCNDVDVCPGFDDNVDTDGDTTPDGCDACPLDAQNDADGDGICANDEVAGCENDPNPACGEVCYGEGGDTDGDLICDDNEILGCEDDPNPNCGSSCYPDMDSDGDLICDGNELPGCVNDANPNCGAPCYPDVDSDGDGICDGAEFPGCVNDPSPNCGQNCYGLGGDTDGDGICDDNEAPGCVNDPSPACGSDCYPDADTDMDGICDADELAGCVNDPNPACGAVCYPDTDTDGDLICDGNELPGCVDDANPNCGAPCYPDVDSDGDGVCDAVDACPGFNDANDADGDMLPDGCDACPLDPNNDIDGDDICGDVENEGCENDPNPDCGVSACYPDVDSDGDGVCDAVDVCPGFNDNLDSDGDTTPDGCDACPNDAQNDADGDGVCGDLDICPGFDDNVDTDGDTTPDGCDACPLDAQNDADGDGVCGDVDVCPGYDDNADLDGDTIPDGCDTCPNDAANDVDGDGFCADQEICDTDPLKQDEGQCGCNNPDTDTDLDGIADCVDPCINDAQNDIDGDGFCADEEECDTDPLKQDVGQCGCGNADTDTDGDSIADCVDPCVFDAQNDEDGDGFCADEEECDTDPLKQDAGQCGCGNADTDSDSDGVADCNDVCPYDALNDEDGDGVCGDVDVCPGFDDNVDTDGDTTPDGCDACPLDALNDEDGDGVCGDVDVCPGFDDNVDTDGDTTPDGCDVCPNDAMDDEDGDGFCADQEECDTDPLKQDGGQCGCNNPDTDTDGDTIADCVDTCPNDAENDADDDGVCGDLEECDYDPNKTAGGICGCGVSDVDGDNDGLADFCEDPCIDNFENNCCQTAADCGGAEFCEIEDGTCGVDGLCATLPMECGEVAAPVCGCDGATYFTECEADYAEAAVEVADLCAAPASCIDNADCAAGEFCFEDGYCMIVPEMCPATGTEVCGFNGTTYGNACFAAAAGVAVDVTGASCPTGGEPCNYHSDCADGDYCAGEGCSAELGTCDPYFDSGTCTPKRDEAECILEPVVPTCGCNAVFYLNLCGAEAAGARYAYPGICAPVACAALPDGVTGDDSLCPCNHKCVPAALGTFTCLPDNE